MIELPLEKCFYCEGKFTNKYMYVRNRVKNIVVADYPHYHLCQDNYLDLYQDRDKVSISSSQYRIDCYWFKFDNFSILKAIINNKQYDFNINVLEFVKSDLNAAFENINLLILFS